MQLNPITDRAARQAVRLEQEDRQDRIVSAARADRAWILSHISTSQTKCSVIEYAGMSVLKVHGNAQPPQLVGLTRSEIVGFSKKSRKRLLETMHKWRDIKNAYFIHLTYPAEFPDDWHVWKQQLNHFLIKLKRAFPRAGWIWKLELQQRGAPHFHLVISNVKVRQSRFRTWLTLVWSKIAHKGDQYEGKYATTANRLYSRDHAFHYAAKYAAKVCDNEQKAMGRIWGYGGNINLEAYAIYHVDREELDILHDSFSQRLWQIGSRYADKFSSMDKAKGWTAFSIGVDCDIGWTKFHDDAIRTYYIINA